MKTQSENTRQGEGSPESIIASIIVPHIAGLESRYYALNLVLGLSRASKSLTCLILGDNYFWSRLANGLTFFGTAEVILEEFVDCGIDEILDAEDDSDPTWRGNYRTEYHDLYSLSIANFNDLSLENFFTLSRLDYFYSEVKEWNFMNHAVRYITDSITAVPALCGYFDNLAFLVSLFTNDELNQAHKEIRSMSVKSHLRYRYEASDRAVVTVDALLNDILSFGRVNELFSTKTCQILNCLLDDGYKREYRTLEIIDRRIRCGLAKEFSIGKSLDGQGQPIIAPFLRALPETKVVEACLYFINLFRVIELKDSHTSMLLPSKQDDVFWRETFDWIRKV